jgi:two-component system cell cycle sensor histidine kinase/response regulator CckA
MPKVLIVDDERSIRRTLGEFLRQAGYDAVEAEDADVAMAHLRAGAFDVVVSDIVLPRVGGVELLRLIHDTAPEVQVVMMTGEPTVETAAEALRLGATDYLFKPISKAAILRATANAARIKSLEDTRRRLEAENQAHRENLERLVAERTAELRKLARAVDQSPVSIVITDREGRIEFVNPKFTQVSGYTSAEVRGKTPRVLKSGEMSSREYADMWATVLAGREWRGEFHNRRKDGSLFWETASISAVRDPAGEITHFIAVKEDVTERKQLEARFLRAQRIESIGSLASGIAHDLNNILAPILMCAAMLRSEDHPGPTRELAQMIETSAKRAVEVVRQLLGFARGQEGRKSPLQVRHLVGEMVKIARETFPRSIVIQEFCPSDLWLVAADGTQLHQVLLNLFVNARDAMPHGGKLMVRVANVTLDAHYAAMHPDARPGRSCGCRSRTPESASPRRCAPAFSSRSSRPRGTAGAPGWGSPRSRGS